MKIGTFVCWLWGHKFIGQAPWEGKTNWIKNVTTSYCIRCGITRKELLNDHGKSN